MADDTSSASASVPEAESKFPVIKRSWGDIADEAYEEASTSDLNLDCLAVDDTKKLHKYLDDPDDSNIKSVLSLCLSVRVTAGDTLYASAETFEELNLTPDLLKGLYVEMKFERPSKIQAISLPMILTPPHKHLIAHNGSGKTTCFVLGMLSRVDPKLCAPQALCICPTRELTIQVCHICESIRNVFVY
ncbi:DEAD-box ATP-dependent RNA helicase 38-like isoform X2 [Actinidia eriantha]|uniref:DEAD-box ATP-dependent RNA helicase 38-like isoform X2 n=1 Tax=Actinidia eriantha TaxID=165200 RepID=UPI0025835112|nr:DEAD-box ATP-dependent RNA helicase 38-like isoform X2 [Actinidia eriantha]